MLAKFTAAAALAAAAYTVSATPSQASEFGCTVLLCAASQNPSWHGVPHCVPPMTKLISMLSKGKPWPTCPEGGAGRPGFEEYAACPKGYTVGYSSTGGDNGREIPNKCIGRKTTGFCASGNGIRKPSYGHSSINSDLPVVLVESDRHNNDDSCRVEVPRPRRADPYFFDIKNPDTGKRDRFYFNLRT
jgi:hypothetical protein